MTAGKLEAVPRRLEALVTQDRDLLKVLVKEALEQVLQSETTEFLGAGPGERAEGRNGDRADYYGRGLITRVGKIELRVPRDRNGAFSAALFERFQRSEKALVSALAEMYIQGVSTRKVKAITEELCGQSFSASAISAINKGLDEALTKFARRKLNEDYPCLILDARHEKVREDGVNPKLTDWVEEHIGSTLTFYRLPRLHHRHLKSTNMLERLNEELRRRTRVVRIFPNTASCLRLTRAVRRNP